MNRDTGLFKNCERTLEQDDMFEQKSTEKEKKRCAIF